MNIDEDSGKDSGLKSRWIGQHGCFLATFAHMRYVPKYHVLACLSNRFDLYIQWTFSSWIIKEEETK